MISDTDFFPAKPNMHSCVILWLLHCIPRCWIINTNKSWSGSIIFTLLSCQNSMAFCHSTERWEQGIRRKGENLDTVSVSTWFAELMFWQYFSCFPWKRMMEKQHFHAHYFKSIMSKWFKVRLEKEGESSLAWGGRSHGWRWEKTAVTNLRLRWLEKLKE